MNYQATVTLVDAHMKTSDELRVRKLEGSTGTLDRNLLCSPGKLQSVLPLCDPSERALYSTDTTRGMNIDEAAEQRVHNIEQLGYKASLLLTLLSIQTGNLILVLLDL